jgi:hypothetical protein
MCFECPDSSFGLVATVHVRWDFLMFAFPYFCDGLDVGCTRLIVEDLQVNLNALCFETFHDGIVCRDAMVVRFGLEGLHQDDICRIVIREHNVLVTAHCTDWEAP